MTFEQEEGDFVFDGDMAIPPVDHALLTSGGAPGPDAIFLNFDGATIAPSGWSQDNAQAGTSFIVDVPRIIPPFNAAYWGGIRSQVIDQIVAQVQADYAEYDVEFTSTRPSSGTYTMVVVGGTPADIGRSSKLLGLAPVDAPNWNPNDVAFAFSDAVGSKGYSIRGLGQVITHEIAHTVGLEHVASSNDIMRTKACSCALTWGSGSVVGDPSRTQDDNTLLLAAFGAQGREMGTPPCSGGDCAEVALYDEAGRFTVFDTISLDAHASSVQLGDPGDLPLWGDWDCDGLSTPGVFRPQASTAYLANSRTSGAADREVVLVGESVAPIVGDWDGDGCDTISLYEKKTGRVVLRNSLDQALSPSVYYFGNPGDKPFSGDFDGDGRVTVGLHRESTGYAYFRNSHTQGIADFEYYYGNPGDIMIAGDWDGNGIETLAVYRPSNGMLYIRLTNTQGNAEYSLFVGRGYEGIVAVR